MKNEEYMKELEKRLTDFRSARQNMKELETVSSFV